MNERNKGLMSNRKKEWIKKNIVREKNVFSSNKTDKKD